MRVHCRHSRRMLCSQTMIEGLDESSLHIDTRVRLVRSTHPNNDRIDWLTLTLFRDSRLDSVAHGSGIDSAQRRTFHGGALGHAAASGTSGRAVRAQRRAAGAKRFVVAAVARAQRGALRR